MTRIKLTKTIKDLENKYQESFGMPKGMRLDEFFRKAGMDFVADAFEKDYKIIDDNL